MRRIEIVEDPRRQATDESFCEELRDNRLHLPSTIAKKLRAAGITSADELATAVTSFPEEVARQLGWGVSRLSRAVGKLIRVLQGMVPDEILHPGRPTKRAFGVPIKKHGAG